MKKILKRALAAVCSAAMALALSSCGIYADPYSAYSKTSEEISGNILQSVFGKRVDESAEIISAENAEKLRAAFNDIRINGSRITLPLMVCDLPEGLTVRQQDSIGESSGYSISLAEIGTEEQKYATAIIIKKSSLDSKFGVIAALILSSQECSWSVGEIDRSFDGEFLESKLGRPSSAAPVADEDHSDYTYMTEEGEAAIFMGNSNMAMLLSIDCSELKSDAELCSFSAFDKFTPDEPQPLLTGEKRDFDISPAFEDDAVVIGKFKSKANALIGELGEDVILQPTSSKIYSNNPDYMEEWYDFYVFGRYIGVLGTLRDKDEPVEKAIVCWWGFFADDVLSEASAMNIPFGQSIESLSEIYSSYYDGSGLKFCGLTRNDGREYYVEYHLSGGGGERFETTLHAVPTDIGSYLYNNYLEENGEQ